MAAPVGGALPMLCFPADGERLERPGQARSPVRARVPDTLIKLDKCSCLKITFAQWASQPLISWKHVPENCQGGSRPDPEGASLALAQEGGPGVGEGRRRVPTPLLLCSSKQQDRHQKTPLAIQMS